MAQTKRRIVRSMIVLMGLVGLVILAPQEGFATPAPVFLETQKVAPPGKNRLTLGGGGGFQLTDLSSAGGGGGLRYRHGLSLEHEIGIEGFYAYPGNLFAGKFSHKWQITRHVSWINSVGIGGSANTNTTLMPQFDTAFLFGTDNERIADVYAGIRLGAGVSLQTSGTSAPVWTLGAWGAVGFRLHSASWLDFYAEVGAGLTFLPEAQQNNILPMILFTGGFDFKF